MKKVIIFHGMPEKHEYTGIESQMHWLPWLKRELEGRGYEVFTPELPKPYEPYYPAWLETLKQFDIDEGTILIGHSCGGGFFVRFLAENEVKVDKVFLVAPWLDPHKHLLTEFFEFNWEGNISEKTKGITTFVSEDDGRDVLESVENLTKKVQDIEVIKFHDHGHFTKEDMKTDEFPELLEAILKK